MGHVIGVKSACIFLVSPRSALRMVVEERIGFRREAGNRLEAQLEQPDVKIGPPPFLSDAVENPRP